MKTSRKKMCRIYYFFIILGLLTFMQPITSLAATQSKSNQNKVKALEEGKVYKYDLDGDGKEETLKYTTTENEKENTVKLKISIDSKLCHYDSIHGIGYHVFLLDLNQNEDRPYLFIQGYGDSFIVENAFFAQVNQDKSLTTIPFHPDDITKYLGIYRYTLESTDGKGNFTLSVDSPVYSSSIGCYYCNITFQIKNEEISLKPASTFTLSKYSKTFKYKAAKEFSVYKKAGSKTVAYKVKKGDTVTFDKMYLSKSGKAYFRMINSKGKKGWIQADQKNLFTELPAWG